MARVQRSWAAVSDSSAAGSAGFPSTGLFTPVDKEPDIGSPPGKKFKKNRTFELATRLGGRGLVSPECPSFDDQVTAADPSKGSETGSSGIGEVFGSTTDRGVSPAEGCVWKFLLCHPSDIRRDRLSSNGTSSGTPRGHGKPA